MSDSAVHAVAGAAGGCFSMAVTYPLINVSTRAQVETRTKGDKSFLQAVREVIRRDGVLALYDGLSSSLMGISVTQGLYYLFYEESRAIILRSKQAKGIKTLSTLESMLTSLIAGSAVSILTNPIWVINTRQTVRTSLASSSSEGGSNDEESQKSEDIDPKTGKKVVIKKLGFVATLIGIIKQDGVKRLFDGLGPALLLVLNPILQYTLFEQLKNRILASNNETMLRDRDTFWLGAFTKLIATGATYPILTVKSRMQAGSAEGRSYATPFSGLHSIVKNEGISTLYRGIGPKLTQSVLTAAILMAAKERIYRSTKSTLVAARLLK